MLNQLISGKEKIFAAYAEIQHKMFSTEKLEQELAELKEKINQVNADIVKLITENASHALDQNEYNKNYAKLTQTYDLLIEKRTNLMGTIAELHEKEKDMQRFLEKLKTLDAVEEFDESIWMLLLDSMTVYSKNDIKFTFMDGTDIHVK